MDDANADATQDRRIRALRADLEELDDQHGGTVSSLDLLRRSVIGYELANAQEHGRMMAELGAIQAAQQTQQNQNTRATELLEQAAPVLNLLGALLPGSRAKALILKYGVAAYVGIRSALETLEALGGW